MGYGDDVNDGLVRHSAAFLLASRAVRPVPHLARLRKESFVRRVVASATRETPSLLRRAHERGLLMVDLSHADFDLYNFGGMNLSGFQFGSADLARAHFESADLKNAQMFRVNLAGADLRHALLCRADLREAVLDAAEMLGADLTGTRLQGATLRWADLRSANFTGCDVSGADLSNARMSADFDRSVCTYDTATKWP